MEGRDLSPTPTALASLREEHQVMRDGYSFLDEKRLSLASRILEELEPHRAVMAECESLGEEARRALEAAMGRHGYEDLKVYPPAVPAGVAEIHESKFLGVVLQEEREIDYSPGEPTPGVDPSPEAGECARVFAHLVRLAAKRGIIEANLQRLLDEYHDTARRAQALEDAVLPELEDDLKYLVGAIEELEQEEAVRARLHAPERV
ncbi:MAG: V-type ATP synthase subunit D [Pseudomonadota bacterium]